MARLFILFLIALLPLRGWTAQRMVFAMEGAPAHVLQLQASDSAMADDCPLHKQASAHSAPASDAGSAHGGCQACQLCMPLAALDSPVQPGINPMAQAIPVRTDTRFVSADTARHAKPPIS